MKMRIVIAVLACVTGYAQQARQEPQFTKDGQLMPPKDYREWVFVSSGLGMTYGPLAQGATAEHPRFENVFVNPRAYKAFLDTGAWPDKTMFILEVRNSKSNGSINKAGQYQEEIVGVQAEVKDEARFPGNWGFFRFPQSGEPAAMLPVTETCYACHSKNGAVDNTFVQFYPTLSPIAKAKGTFKPSEK
jgi:hypothetical protein